MDLKKYFSIALTLATISCGSIASSQSDSTACLNSSTSIRHEHEFNSNSDDTASFNDVTVIDLESATTDDSELSDLDTGEKGIDRIPYTVTTSKTYSFTVADGPHEKIEIQDENSTVLYELFPGDTDVSVTLDAGQYNLVLYNQENNDHGYVYVMPTNCSSSQQSLLTKHLTSTTSNSGVYIATTDDSSIHSIPSASSNVTAFVGYVAQGPANQPYKIESMSEFNTNFGALDETSHLSYAVSQFFINGGKTAYIVRVPKNTNGSLPNGTDLIGSENTYNGLYALARLSDASINTVVIPDLVRLDEDDYKNIISTILDFTKNLNAIAIMDVPLSVDSPENAVALLASIPNLTNSTQYGAFYYPPIGLSRANKVNGDYYTGSTGSVAGLFASIDSQVGVWTPPSGTQNGSLKNISSLQYPDVIDPSIAAKLEDVGKAVNLIKQSIDKKNIYIDTSKTISYYTSDFRYIAVRRTLNYLENSIKFGISWAVFSPNNSTLWTELVQNIGNFLNAFYQAGGLKGTSAANAYTVICGLGSTMTATDIANNVVNVNILVALSQPAEFITLTVAQSVNAQ